jgi:hypothetical protein
MNATVRRDRQALCAALAVPSLARAGAAVDPTAEVVPTAAVGTTTVVAMAMAAITLAFALACPRRADAAEATDSTEVPAWVDDAPAPVDAAQLRNVEPRTRVYIDATFAQSPDLSALPYIVGSGKNYRAAIGGSLRWRRFQFDTELPAAQSTTLDLTQVPGGMPIPEDQRQTASSIGDLRLGAQWTEALPVDALPLVAGLSLRVRVPTHTTRFQFHLVDGSLGIYGFPYYFHIEPAALLGGAVGDFSFVVNQGAVVLVGPDGNFGELHIVVPTITFWDSHYAIAYRLLGPLTVSVELAATLQLNHVEGLNFQKLNDVRSLAVIPGVQLRLRDNLRLDVVGRWGLTHGADLFGVIGFAGSRSFTLRLTWLL